MERIQGNGFEWDNGHCLVPCCGVKGCSALASRPPTLAALETARERDYRPDDSEAEASNDRKGATLHADTPSLAWWCSRGS
jgi:hypothetical protein